MIKAIIYTSNTGTTAQYAKLLGEKTGLPICSLLESSVPKDSEIIYLGWVMASSIKGYKKAARQYRVRTVCGVCMGATGSQLAEVRKQNAVPVCTPVFTMQGGFDVQKLHGVYRLMMDVMVQSIGKGLAEKKDRTPDEDIMLDMILHGGNHVNTEHLKNVLDWYAAEQAKAEPR